MVMPYTSTNNVSATPPKYEPITQDKFDKGVISVIHPSKLPLNALVTADNHFLDEDGAPIFRPGSDWYGSVLPSSIAIDGAGSFTDDQQNPHLVIVSNGNVYRSLDDGHTWDICSGGSFTVGKKVRMTQVNSFLNMFDAYDNIIRYDGTTALIVYEVLEPPGINTITATGLAGTGILTYYYRIAAVNAVGTSMGSVFTVFGGVNPASIAVDRIRSTWDSTNFVTLTWLNGLADFNNSGTVTVEDAANLSIFLSTGTAPFGDPIYMPVRYDIFIGTTQGEETYIDSVDVSSLAPLDTVTYVDKAQSPQQDLILVPDSNTTLGPRVGDMVTVGTRLYTTQDRDFPWRVWISAAGRDIGKFSTAFDGTYIDLQKGTQFRPMKVEEYQDGKGNPLATVWCDGADGFGCIWQGSLDTFTVGDVSFPVPNFFKLSGSRGTNAPDSVVNVLNDYLYYNSQAIYNLGPRVQFLNLLSTDEASANIRPDIRKTRNTASSGVCSFFFEANVYFSVPYNNDSNNSIALYDTERKAWLPRAFTFGVERFFSYTDISGTTKLLCWKPGDDQLTEISSAIRGDYGVAFRTVLETGLSSVNPKNRFDFAWVDEGDVELSEVSGIIDVELKGVTRDLGYATIDTVQYTPNYVAVSWSSVAWTTRAWSATSLITVTNYSEPSEKRYFNVQDDVNCFAWVVTSEDIHANYVPRTLQLNTTATEGGKPREWEILPG